MIAYDPAVVSFEQILKKFWNEHTPYASSRQYRSAVFVHNDDQRRIAQRVQETFIDSGKRFVKHTAIEDASDFYAAEGYHQQFIAKQLYGSAVRAVNY